MTSVSAAERVARAREAQRQWAEQPTAQRTRVLARLRREIAAHRDAVVQAVVADTGKPPLDALTGDVLFPLEQMRFYERHAARVLRPRRLRHGGLLFAGTRSAESREPYGVALVYAPANYPFQLAMVPAVTALYAGNAVLLKMSERTPAVADILEQICASVLPAGLVQVLRDEPAAAAAYLDAGPDLLFFTGSTHNGRELAARAARKLIPAVLELGGKDAALVFADCDLTRTVEGVVYGAFANAGQVCVGIKRVYVERAIHADFLKLLCERVRTLRIGSGQDCDLGTLRGEAARGHLLDQVADALARGAQLEAGSASSAAAPLVLSDVPAGARLLTEETFGPVLCVAPFDSEAQAIALANASEFALSASVWTGDSARGQRVAARLDAGTCAVNDVIRNIAHPGAAFGGNRASGFGRYHGEHGLMAFTRAKTTMTARARRRHEVHWFPFTSRTFKALDTFLELRHRPRGWWGAVRRLFCITATWAAGSMLIARYIGWI